MKLRTLRALMKAAVGHTVPERDLRELQTKIIAGAIKAESDHNKRQATIDRLKKQSGAT